MSTIKVSRKDLYDDSSEYQSDSDSESGLTSYGYVPDFEIEEVQVDVTAEGIDFNQDAKEHNAFITSESTTREEKNQADEEAYAFNLFSCAPTVPTSLVSSETMEIDDKESPKQKEDNTRMIRLDTPDPDEFFIPTFRPEGYYRHTATPELLAQYNQAAVTGQDIWAAALNLTTPKFGTTKGKLLEFSQLVQAAKKEKRGLGRPGAKRRKILKAAKTNKAQNNNNRNSGAAPYGERFYGPSRIYGNDFFKDINEQNFGFRSNSFRINTRGGKDRGGFKGGFRGRGGARGGKGKD
ncbi:hypothetical protein NADFUDRAFT_48060 [Nadsonia fulvescens var. elongata DSM 6958]|uniref:Uncharacterized protein n=1 Tax=Nadsonia fulvescens var. elongata DSM 6958 TaxID=857566 RepID=A0A1E3PEJ1_9ASCO|nr:hypothetical protein NADFUDRAFT_48060 [Nadsonia fulvescens var. elongata DSM 6958]